MDGITRRQAITALLSQSRAPVSATVLAQNFSVSRQLIVGDIALLRAGGLEITATPRGYLLPTAPAGLRRVVACVHPPEGMARELEIMVDHGCQVLDVVVEHPVYGQLVGQLRLTSRRDVEAFLKSIGHTDSQPLSNLTGGIHLHTLSCPSAERFRLVLEELERAGFLLPGQTDPLL